MVLRGQVQNGTAILDEPADRPDRTRVRVELLSVEGTNRTAESAIPLREQLLKPDGRAEGLPADAAERHDEFAARQELP